MLSYLDSVLEDQAMGTEHIHCLFKKHITIKLSVEKAQKIKKKRRIKYLIGSRGSDGQNRGHLRVVEMFVTILQISPRVPLQGLFYELN